MSEGRKFATVTLGDLAAIGTIILAAGAVYVGVRTDLQRLEDGAAGADKRIDQLEQRVDGHEETLRKVDVMANDIGWIKDELMGRHARSGT